MIKFKETLYGQHLNEIRQSLDIRMAFVRKGKDGHYTNIHEFVKCRDFMGDVLHAIQAKKAVKIYGFSYNPKNQLAPYSRKFMVACKFPDVTSRANFIVNSHILKKYDSKVKLTILPDQDFILVEASPLWVRSVAGLSFFTFLLKCIGYYWEPTKLFWENLEQTTAKSVSWDGIETFNPTIEAQYYKDTKKNLEKFVELLPQMTKNLKTKHGHDQNADISRVHNYSGFVSVCKFNNGVGIRFKNLLGV